MKTETLEQKGIKNADQEKNTFLLTHLQIIVSELKAREVFKTDWNGGIAYHQGHLDETGEAIQKLIQGSVYNNGGLTITNGENKYTVNLLSAEAILTELEQEVKRDWSKTTYKWDWRGIDCKYTRLYPTIQMPKDYELIEKNHRGIAEAFTSYEDLMSSPEYNDAQNNYETALKAKALYEQNGQKNEAKKLEKLASYFEKHASAWKRIAKFSEHIDYSKIDREGQ